MPDVTEFRPAARQPKGRLEPKKCLENSLDLALMRPGLRYAEGIAKNAVGIWLAHAWNVNPAGEAVDYTWEETGLRYLGRVIGTDRKLATTVARGTYEFDRPLPYVPDGELGIGVYTRQEADWIAGQLRRAGS